MDAVLAAIVEAPTSPDTGVRLPVLLADFLGCVRAAETDTRGSSNEDGVAGSVWRLAHASSLQDRDDIDWRSLHHPGSVVWPVVLALAVAHEVPGPLAADAAARGYLTSATVADLLGPGHRAAWHVTATAGAVGAAAAAAVLLGADAAVQERALSLAAANAGGLARAARERRGAAAFNRAAAAGLGLAAARAAIAGAPAVDEAFRGPGGMAVSMSGTVPVPGLDVRDGLADAAPRMLPVSGFLQSAVAGAARARHDVSGDLVQLTLGLTAGALPLVEDGSAGPWWDARQSALRAWAAGSPYAVERAGPLDDQVALVTLAAADVPVGHARVRATTDSGTVELLVAPPSPADPDVEALLVAKWSAVLGESIARELVPAARSALEPEGRPSQLLEAMVR